MIYSPKRKEGLPMALSADLLRGYTDTIILNQLAETDSYGYAPLRTTSPSYRLFMPSACQNISKALSLRNGPLAP